MMAGPQPKHMWGKSVTEIQKSAFVGYNTANWIKMHGESNVKIELKFLWSVPSIRLGQPQNSFMTLMVWATIKSTKILIWQLPQVI